MPRTMFVLPTSTTRRLDTPIGYCTITSPAETAIVDAAPRSGDLARADDRRNAIAVLVNREAAPFVEHCRACGALREPRVEIVDECDGRVFDRRIAALRGLANRRRVRPRI